MAKTVKSWQEKLTDSKDLPRVVKLTPKLARRWGAKPNDTLLVPAPIEVDEVMKRVPDGSLTTINEVRTVLAKKHGANLCCPITTGIFARIAAGAAEEAAKQGKKNITPYWRTLKAGGEINPKYPGGVEYQKELLEKEGHRIIKKGERFLVLDYEKQLAKL
jgi:alkylated DNA nucleotide flippase Atl1